MRERNELRRASVRDGSGKPAVPFLKPQGRKAHKGSFSGAAIRSNIARGFGTYSPTHEAEGASNTKSMKRFSCPRFMGHAQKIIFNLSSAVQ